MTGRRWYPNSWRSRVYVAVADAGPLGIGYRELRKEFRGAEMLPKLSEALRILSNCQYITVIEPPVMQTRCNRTYVVDGGCIPAPIIGREFLGVLQCLADCPAGMTADVLADAVIVSEDQLKPMLFQALGFGFLTTLRLHGGIVWAVGPRPFDAELHEPLSIDSNDQGINACVTPDGGIRLTKGTKRLLIERDQLGPLFAEIHRLRPDLVVAR